MISLLLVVFFFCLHKVVKSAVPQAVMELSVNCAALARMGESATTSLESAPVHLDGWCVVCSYSSLIWRLEWKVNCSLSQHIPSLCACDAYLLFLVTRL